MVYLLAPLIDQFIDDSVFSYRLRDNFAAETGLFRESFDPDTWPFLKRKTVAENLDPFDPWYAAWPEFDDASRETIEGSEYRYLATSDITAYFENIQLALLRDELLSLLPNEPEIINLLMACLEMWTIETSHRRFGRGIPQGTMVSSFLGNVFLRPIDTAFRLFRETHTCKYLRYGDDIRIFTTNEVDAREALVLLSDSLRRLHLNVQTAKTRILRRDEMSVALVDERLTKLNLLIRSVHEDRHNDRLTNARRSRYLGRLQRIADMASTDPAGRKLSDASGPLPGLSFRVLRRWMTAR
jgi:hypothetical protein